MTRRFCAECGASNVPLHDNFCQKCYWKFNHILSSRKRRLEVPYCLTCFAIKTPNGWSSGQSQEEIPEAIGYGYMRNVLADPDVDIQLGEISNINWVIPNPEFTIEYLGRSYLIEEFDMYEERIVIEFKLVGGVCKTCVRRKTGTHDVTLQLRAKNRSLSKSEIDKATNIAFTVANTMFNESTDAYVSDIIENHGGLDIYLGSNSLADELIIQFKKQWIGHHEKNYKLITEEKDNKRVYRVTHLYRIPSVKEGEFVVYNNELHKVRYISSNSVKILRLLDRKTIAVHDWENLTNPDPHPFIVNKMVVSEDPVTNSYLLMDLTSYENEEIDKNRFPDPLEIGDEVELLKWDEKYYQSVNI